MPRAQEVADWRGRRVVDSTGDEIGTLEEVDDDQELTLSEEEAVVEPTERGRRHSG